MSREPFDFDIPLRWVDLDAQAHVNNAKVVDVLQEARVAFLLGGPNAHLLGDGIIVVGHQVEYLRSIDFTREPLRVRLSIGHVGASRFTLGYEVQQSGVPVARAHTVLCYFDFERGRPARLPQADRAWFTEHATHLEPVRSLGAWEVGDEAHVHPFLVRWSDLDAYGHVNNVRFFDYVAEARIAMNAELLPRSIRSSLQGEVEHLWMVARQDLHYVGQLEHRLEPYRVRTAVGHVGRTSLTKVAQIEDPLDGRVLARSLTVVVYAGPDGRPAPIPDAVRAAAQRWPARHPERGGGGPTH